MPSRDAKVAQGVVVFTLSFLFLFLFCLPAPSRSQPDDWEKRILAQARYTSGGFKYVPFQAVAEALQAHTYYSTKVHKAVLYLGAQKLTVSAFNPFVLVGKQVRQMPVETKFANGDILVPASFFVPIVRAALAANGGFDVTTGLPTKVNLSGVRVEEKANGTLIRVQTSKSFPRSSISTRYSRRWLYLDVLGGRLNEQAFATHIEPGLVKRVETLQLSQLAQLSFHLTKDISSKEVQVSLQADQILISIPTKDQLSQELLEKLKSDRDKWKIDVVVIDPGHGGKDPGAIGPRGVYEKDVVLGIAKKLKKLLEKKLKIKVYLTRDSDKFISLKERTKFANQKQGKLFISIHANWNPNRRVRGTSTYFLGLAKSDEALEIAQRENAVIRYEENHGAYEAFTDEHIILATMAQNAYNKESQDFAAMIQRAINKKTGLVDRGVKQAGFYVLVGASMPNVLVETAFISNRKEERLLKQASFQQKIAEGIFESVKRFKEKYEKELLSEL